MIRKIKDSFNGELEHLINKVIVALKEIKQNEKLKISSTPIIIDIENVK